MSFYALLASAAVSSVSAVGTYLTNADPIEGSYFVRLHKKFKNKDVEEHLSRWSDKVNVTYTYPTLSEYGFPAYAAKFDEDTMRMLLLEDEVEFVEQDGWAYAHQGQCSTETQVTWGIGRVGARGDTVCTGTTDGTGNCDWSSISSGSDVNVYILDTGVYCGNNEFSGRDCAWAYSADSGPLWCNPGDDNCDGNGHGTHCAGTAAGNTYGIDQRAKIRNVQVLSSMGSGSLAGVVAGVDYAAGADSGEAGVLSMSLGGSGNSQSSTSQAVDACVRSGRAVSVAAGNSNEDACNASPASAELAITVGATANTGGRNVWASYSNYGRCVDILAPGSSITSAWVSGPSSTNTISGTSMACPHVTGVISSWLAREPTASPDKLWSTVDEDTVQGIVQNVAQPLTTPNKMLHFDCNN